MKSTFFIQICRYLLAFQTILFIQIQTSYSKILVPQQSGVLPINLPLTIYPTSVIDSTIPLVFMISGDGGWTRFDNEMCENLAKNGLAVVALDAQKYFWNPRTPMEASAEIARSVQYYMQLWNKKDFILLGFSFGASLVPFITEYFPQPLQQSLKGIYGLSPDLKADFEIHLGDMLGFGNKKDTYDVLSQMIKMKRFNPVCIFGEDEPLEVRSKFMESGIKIITVPGNHHYNSDAIKITGVIADEVKRSGLKK